MAPRAAFFFLAPLVMVVASCSDGPQVSEALPSVPTAAISAIAEPTPGPGWALRFAAGGREVRVEGAKCEEDLGRLRSCTGDIRVTVVGAEALAPVRLRELVLTKEFPLHVGEGDLVKPGATPTFALVDYDRDGLEDLAVAVDRLGSYGQLSYVIFLRRVEGWVFSPEFSALTEVRMGLPRREGDAWLAFGKSGCCQHWEERYDVVDGKPVLRETEITTSLADGTTTTELKYADDSGLNARSADGAREAMCRMSNPTDVITAWAESPTVRHGQIAADLRSRLSAEELSADAAFDGFRLGILDYRWRYVEPHRDPGDWPPILWDTDQYQGGFVMTLKRSRWGEHIGEGEDDHAVVPEPGPGQRYVFVRRDDCWVLAAVGDRVLPSDIEGQELHWPTADGAPVIGVELSADAEDLGEALFARRSEAMEMSGVVPERSEAFLLCVDAAGGSDVQMTECEFEEQTRLERRFGDMDASRKRGREQWQARTDIACAWYPTYEGTLARLHAATCVTNRLSALVIDRKGKSSAEPAATTVKPLPRCLDGEQTLFSCSLGNGKQVALCASSGVTSSTGYVRYAYGSGDLVELAVPSPLVAAGERFRSTSVLYPSGNGRHAYSLNNGEYRYVLYRTWEARDGDAAGGGLMVLDGSGAQLMHQRCRAMGDAEQSSLAMPPTWMPADALLDEGSGLDFTPAQR